MYYIVGSWKNYSFVFDSSDNSCEMVDNDKLKNSGIACQPYIDKPVDMVTAILTYGVPQINHVHEKMLVEYTIGLSNGKSCRASLNLMIVPKSWLGSKSVPYFKFSSYGYPDDYGLFLFIRLNQWGVDKNNSAGLQEVLVEGYGTFYGVVVPRLMMNFIMQIAKSHNLHGIFSVTDGLFYNKLHVSHVASITNNTVERCTVDTSVQVSDINWV